MENKFAFACDQFQEKLTDSNWACISCEHCATAKELCYHSNTAYSFHLPTVDQMPDRKVTTTNKEKIKLTADSKFVNTHCVNTQHADSYCIENCIVSKCIAIVLWYGRPPMIALGFMTEIVHTNNE